MGDDGLTGKGFLVFPCSVRTPGATSKSYLSSKREIRLAKFINLNMKVAPTPFTSLTMGSAAISLSALAKSRKAAKRGSL